MINLMLHSLQPFHGAVNFILAQFYSGVNKGSDLVEEVALSEDIWTRGQITHEDFSLVTLGGLNLLAPEDISRDG